MPFKTKEAKAAYSKKYRKRLGEILLEKKRSYWKRQRLIVLYHYSKGKLECKCCKENIYEFLALDHIKGGGTQHRKKLGSKYIYSWLIKNNFPKGYQVLCHNCNQAKGFHGKCPHKKRKHQFKNNAS